MAPSEAIRGKLAAAGIPVHRIHVVPNFLAVDPGPGAGGGYAIFAGRLCVEKGVETLLRAWAELSEAPALKIVGDGPLSDLVRRAAERDERIEWLGWRSPDDVLDLIGGARCLILPSLFHEAFGRVVIEAYAKGTPVLAARRGALAEIVEEGLTGHLFEPGSSSELIAKLRLLTAESSYTAMRLQCRRRFEERYLGKRCYDDLMRLYDSALRHREER
jgi:glycosyltransferase involved in cell wall biosynthesis